MSTPDQRRQMGAAIVDLEARRDRAGHLMVYAPPGNDGGGAYEVAGINVRYHPTAAQSLKALIEAGRFNDAEAQAIQFVLDFTQLVTNWHPDPGVEFYLRDTAFNRGSTGAARILQRAVGVTDDGEVGPETRAAVARFKGATDLLTQLRAARENYERLVVGYRANFWSGLVNRWDKALATARKFSTGAPAPAPTAKPATSWWQALLDWLFRGTAATPAAPPPVPKEPPWLTLARRDIGFRETGVNRGIERFIAAAKTGKLGDPWCAIWVNAKLEDAGVRGTRSAMARSFEASPHFQRLSGPALGAIVTMWRKTPKSGQGHVFFYLADGAAGVIGIGANENDGVRTGNHDRIRITGYWWPKALALPSVGKIVTEADSAAASTET